MAWMIAIDPTLTSDDYEVGVKGIQGALGVKQGEPAYINTLGILQYRLDRFEEALSTLALSLAFYSEKYEHGVPADLAFIAMSHHQLGHVDEAQTAMRALRQAMLIPELSEEEDNQRHFAEAEAMLGS